MELISFTDSRLNEAVRLLAAGGFRLLSLDLFDTLLARRVPLPRDVFLRLGARLAQENALGPGLNPDSFAALRYQTEYAARGRQQRAHGHREVTLQEIYGLMPRQTSSLSADQLAQQEIEVEHELCFALDETVALARWAKKQGLGLAILSNSYFPEKVLRDLLRAKAPGLSEPDLFLVSCDHRCGKRDGLMRALIEQSGLTAAQILHIGDNPVSDRLAAQEHGVPFLFVGYDETDMPRRLREEHPIQWHARADRFAAVGGDYGLTALRCQAGFWTDEREEPETQPYFTYGARHMGPLLAGFAAWAATRARQIGTAPLFPLLREGALLTDLVGLLDPDLSCRPLAASRLSAALAGFAPDFPEHLEDFLTRRGFWTLGALLRQLGFDESEAACLGDPAATLDLIPAPELTRRLLDSPLAPRLFEASAEKRKRLLRYLKNSGALDADRLVLMDLGYAATIQRGFQRLFKIEKIPVTTHGLYMAGAHVSLATQQAGGIVEGFLAQNGNPNDFVRAFCRCPEIVELACMPAHGTLDAYDENGTPRFAPDTAPEKQQKQVAALQRGARTWARRWRQIWPRDPDFCQPSWAQQMRDLAQRLVVYPTAPEARLMGDWLADSDLGLASPRPLLSQGGHAIEAMNGAELAALPRRDLPWLFGIAAQQGPLTLTQAASVLLRRDEPRRLCLPFEESET